MPGRSRPYFSLAANVSAWATSPPLIWHGSCSHRVTGPDSHKEHRYGSTFRRRQGAGHRPLDNLPGDRARTPPCRTQLRPAAGRAGARRRLLAVGRARPPLSRHDERVLGREPRPRASAHRARAGRAGAAARRHLARLPQRAPAGLPAAADHAHRARSRAAGLRRRRGGRNRAQGRAQVGPQDQGYSRRPRGDHRVRGQFPRPVDHDRRLLVGAAVPRRLRAVPAGIPARAVRRRRRARACDRSQHRGVPGRADPGRRRHPRSAGRLSRAVRADLPRAQRPSHLRRNPDRHGPHRQVPCVRARRCQARRRHPRQGAGRRPPAGLGARRHRRPDAGVHAGRPRQHVRRQSAGGGGWPLRRSTYCSTRA